MWRADGPDGSGRAKGAKWDYSSAPRSAKRALLLDRVRGCLLGGAVGDALGYPVEFLSRGEIDARFGADGIWGYEITDPHGRALFSDDTQMTLFTAVGLLEWGTSPVGADAPTESIYRSYLDWLATQGIDVPQAPHASWLADVRALHEPRAPGNTCLTALGSGRMGRIGDSLNSSKGCGGVMRVAPIGLFGGSVGETVRWAAEAAAITHGHPLGYLPAAALAFIVRECAFGLGAMAGPLSSPTVQPLRYDGAPLDGVGASSAPKSPAAVLTRIVERCIAGLPTWFPEHAVLAADLASLLGRARDLAANGELDRDNIPRLGEGWVGDEALAIAVYCCLRNPASFDGAVIAAVNHGGDSDSTGAIAGNIMGALLGETGVNERWKQDLELRELVLEVADALFEGRMPSQERLASAYAQRAHFGQRDKGGAPYIEHPATVAARVQGDSTRAAAWLHDVVEDTAATLDDLRRHGFSEEVVQAVGALTRHPGEDYLAFVQRAAANSLARPVKLADVVHNMDLSRLPAVDAAAVERVRVKYLPALELLVGSRITVRG